LIPLVMALSALCIVVGAIRARRVASTLDRARRTRAQLGAIASLLDIESDRMAPILGASDAAVRHWMVNGVPADALAAVRRTLATATALRRVVSASVACRLLERRARREGLGREVASLTPVLRRLPMKRFFVRIRD
jgi:hypothetical protein